MDAGGRAPTVGALGDAGAVAEDAEALIPQEIFSQSLVITDTRLLREFLCETCETNALRDLYAKLNHPRQSRGLIG